MITIPEELQTALKSIIDIIDKRDKDVREQQIRQWKGLELYWKHIQNIFWDSSASVPDYRFISSDGTDEAIDPYYIDKIINIYRAHGESILAALSQDVPQVVFTPDDADNHDDIVTAQTFTKGSELINRTNKAPLLLLRAMYLMYNQGLIGAYIYPKQHKKFGTEIIKQYGSSILNTHYQSCPICGMDLGSVETRDNEQPPIMMQDCPACEQQVNPVVDTTQEQIPTITGYLQQNKSRPAIEFYGGLNLRVYHNARTQEECGYIILETDSDEAYAKGAVKDKATREKIVASGDTEQYGRWARAAMEEETGALVTWRRVWLRPWMFYHVNEELAAKLLKKFPNGCYFLLINDVFIEADDEDMDSCWVLAENPTSSHIHSEPIGAVVKPVQDIHSEIIHLQLQSLEYGIPETWADPAVVDFATYGQIEAAPGQLLPAKSSPAAGRSLQDSFTTLKTATYPRESEDFKKSIMADGQFVLGDFPSIYGGPAQGGSKTYAEYSSSRAQALQRLSNIWKLLSFWWADIMTLAVKVLIENMNEDEKFVKKEGNRYINIWIRKTEATGRIGHVEPETANSFPMSWAQKHDALIKLLEFQSPEIMSVITHPENVSTVGKYLGFSELFIPGEDDRNKQLQEIADLLDREPLDDVTPSVPIDPQIDNHQLEYETCVTWLKSEYGLDAKITNPAGYMNVRLHAMAHQQAMAMQAMPSAPVQGQGNEAPSPDNNANLASPEPTIQ